MYGVADILFMMLFNVFNRVYDLLTFDIKTPEMNVFAL